MAAPLVAAASAAVAAPQAAAAPILSPPSTQRCVLRAAYDDEGIWCFQAYAPSIGHAAAARGRFSDIPGFSLTRMTWIKFSLGWMCYRCNYARSKNQECVLRIKISWKALHAILNEAVRSSFSAQAYASREAWQQAMARSCVRFQWDPERDLHIAKYSNNDRALQLGLGGAIALSYATDPEWILGIEDFTSVVHAIRTAIDEGKPLPQVPEEREYAIESRELRHSLDMEPKYTHDSAAAAVASA